MFNDYILQVKTWLLRTVPAVINEKNFLWIMGGLFLLGIVTKWIVMKNYEKLIKKAKHMKNTKNVTLRQIKNKYESIKQVSKTVTNPTLFVQRHINQCRIMNVSVNKFNHIINWCVIGMVAASGFIGAWSYFAGNNKETAMFYVVMGCLFAFALEVINRNADVENKKLELTYAIVDFLENNYETEQIVHSVVREPEIEAADKEEMRKQEQNRKDEQILNQVIGEFLQ